MPREKNQTRQPKNVPVPDYVEDEYTPTSENKLNLTDLKQKSMPDLMELANTTNRVSGFGPVYFWHFYSLHF